MRFLLSIGSAACFFAVALGAFGAHALKSYLDESQLAIWHTANQYQFFHGIALLTLASLSSLSEKIRVKIGFCFLTGIILFSGSLYFYALFGIKIFAMITPIGGLAFLIAWFLLFINVWKKHGT